jgi:BASS family bile acid:Na+ symporter
VRSVLDVAIPATAILVMTVVGLDLTRADLARVAARPRVVIAGLLGPLALLPPIALFVLAAVPLPAEIGAGLLLLAVCPVGGISNAYNYVARAATALSVTLTAVSCVAAVVTMPLLTRGFELALGRPLGYRAPVGPLAAQVLAMLVLPVALGMTVRARAPGFAARHERAFARVAAFGLALLLGFILVSEWDRFVTNLAATSAASALFVLLAMAAGWLVAILSGADRRERFTLSVEFATRNCAIAAAVAITLLGDTRFAVFATTYFFTEAALVGVAIVAFRRRRDGREEHA